MTKLEFKLFPSQHKVMQSDHNLTLLLCGRGVGKTVVGSHWVVRKIVKDNARGLIIAPIYSQTHELLERVKELLEQMCLTYVFNKQPPKSWGPAKLTNYNNVLSVRVGLTIKYVYVGTGDNSEAVRSKSIGWAVLDEAALLKEELFKKIILPALRGQGADYKYQLLFLTSPRGAANWISELSKKEGVQTFSAASSENFLEYPPDKIKWYKDNMGDLEFKQEILGLIVNASASAMFYNAEDKVFKQIPRPKDSVLYLSLDQNVSPMVGIVGWLIPHKNRIHVFDEIIIQDSANVIDFATLANKKLKNVVKGGEKLILCGDASGNSRSVTAKESFYKTFINNMIRNNYYIVDNTFKSNPPVFESAEKVNNLLANGSLTIDPNLKQLKLDLAKTRYTKDLTTDKKWHDPHAGDSLRYLIWRIAHRTIGGKNMGFYA